MFKTQVVDSRNIRKTVVYQVFEFVVTPLLFIFILLSFNVFGAESPITQFYKSDAGHSVNNIFLLLIVVIVAISYIGSSRAKKPRILGQLEMDENGIKYSEDNQPEISYLWNSVDKLTFEFFSIPNRNNPKGCMNYLTLYTGNEKKIFEIVIENSLAKAGLGELLNEINRRVPVKVTYAILYKIIRKDKDFKLD
jgi:hypothetical protein